MQRQNDYRIFVGAFPKGEVAIRIQTLREQIDPVTARITAPHVTLAGTYWRHGPATAANEAETRVLLQSIQTKVAAFTLVLGGIAIFPPADRPVIYLQVETTPALLAVRSTLLTALGPDKHRRFTPHLTLAMRLKGPAADQVVNWLQQSEWQTNHWSIPIDRLALMQRGTNDPAWREIGQILLAETYN